MAGILQNDALEMTLWLGESCSRANRQQFPALQLFYTQSSFFVPAGAGSCSPSVPGLMANRHLQFHMRHFTFFCLKLCAKGGNSVLPPAPNTPTLLRQFITVTWEPRGQSGAYNFPGLSSPGLSPFTPPLLPSQPGSVFIRSCRISAASIISHCKAIRVLITRGPPSGVIHQLVSATVHMQMKTRVRVLCRACQRHVWTAHNEPIQRGDA